MAPALVARPGGRKVGLLDAVAACIGKPQPAADSRDPHPPTPAGKLVFGAALARRLRQGEVIPPEAPARQRKPSRRNRLDVHPQRPDRKSTRLKSTP